MTISFLKTKTFWIGFVSGVVSFVLLFILGTAALTAYFVPFIDKIADEKSTKPDVFDSLTAQISLVNVKDQKLEEINLNKQKPIFLHFWATWCGPCIKEMEEMIKIEDNAKNLVDFYFLSNEDIEVQKSFIKKKGWNLPFYQYADSLTASNFKIELLPTTFIVKNQYTYLNYAGQYDQWSSKKVLDYLTVLSR